VWRFDVNRVFPSTTRISLNHNRTVSVQWGVVNETCAELQESGVRFRDGDIPQLGNRPARSPLWAKIKLHKIRHLPSALAMAQGLALLR
jgi:hypothetical protein